jgi:hypothetical protein
MRACGAADASRWEELFVAGDQQRAGEFAWVRGSTTLRRGREFAQCLVLVGRGQARPGQARPGQASRVNAGQWTQAARGAAHRQGENPEGENPEGENPEGNNGDGHQAQAQ